MTDTPMIPADVAAARVAAAYEAAARWILDFEMVDDAGNGSEPDAGVLVTLIANMPHALAAADPDGSAALARLLAEARAEVMREAVK